MGLVEMTKNYCPLVDYSEDTLLEDQIFIDLEINCVFTHMLEASSSRSVDQVGDAQRAWDLLLPSMHVSSKHMGVNCK
jgi:hypothetical protein